MTPTRCEQDVYINRPWSVRQPEATSSAIACRQHRNSCRHVDQPEFKLSHIQKRQDEHSPKAARTKRDANKPSPVRRSGPGQPNQTVAGMGDFGRLPPEIRNRIYELLLHEPQVVKLQSYQPRDKLSYMVDGEVTSRLASNEVAPVNHKRNTAHRGQEWDGEKWVEVPSKLALLQVNKHINAEISSMLYGFNSFEFTTSIALERFLQQIGDNKQYLREVGLTFHPGGYVAVAGRRAMLALIAAKNLHTVSLSNVPVETIEADAYYARTYLTMYVQMCLPRLAPLHATLQANGQGADVLDVLKFNRRLPGDRPHPTEIDCRGPGYCFRTCFWHRPDKFDFHLTEVDCSDKCGDWCKQYRERYEWLGAALRDEVAFQLDLK
jgi:hypothetical protein